MAAAAIALGQNEVIEYLDDIVHPVLACFGDQDARVRYYACESMYNISKVAKGEILVYFNELFDALSKLSADPDQSVQTGSDLLNRLLKDIVTEKAATYVSAVRDVRLSESTEPSPGNDPTKRNTSFCLPKFIPLLTERMYAIQPSTRTFLISWITVLDSIPELEFITYLPSFLGGLINFLNDASSDIRVATHAALDMLLQEIKHNTEIRRVIEQERSFLSLSDDDTEEENIEEKEEETNEEKVKEKGGKKEDEKEDAIEEKDKKEDGTVPSTKGINKKRRRSSSALSTKDVNKTIDASSGGLLTQNSESSTTFPATAKLSPEVRNLVAHADEVENELTSDQETQDVEEHTKEETPEEIDEFEGESANLDGVYIPGQDFHIDFDKVIGILISHLDTSVGEIQSVVLEWVENFLDISPLSILPYVPRFLSVLLPTMDYEEKQLKSIAIRVNSKMLDLILSLPDENVSEEPSTPAPPKFMVSTSNEPGANGIANSDESPNGREKLDYSATVNALTLHFLDENEETRVAALDWLIMLHRKVPKRILAINDGTFPALLKTLSDPSEAVITRDLQLLAQISYNSDDEYFKVFMVNLLSLFSTDRRLLETRGNLIIRQLCVSLKPERIYFTLAGILEQEDEDLEFAGIMVQNLSNILITAPELSELRARLRSPNNTKDGVTFFTVLFRSWCHYPSAVIALCLLSQAYEHAFNLLQTIVDFEITVALLIQIDKLVQLLESPVFSHLRLQLLEPEKYPYLYKFLYGLLMILPQSSAFATLRNRLSSVSSIGYLHVPTGPQQRSGASAAVSGSASSRSSESGGGGGRIQFHDVKWPELMVKFNEVQHRHQEARAAHAMNRSFGDMKLYADDSDTATATTVTPGSTLDGKRQHTNPAVVAGPSWNNRREGIRPVAATTTTALSPVLKLPATSNGATGAPITRGPGVGGSGGGGGVGKSGVRKILSSGSSATANPGSMSPSPSGFRRGGGHVRAKSDNTGLVPNNNGTTDRSSVASRSRGGRVNR